MGLHQSNLLERSLRHSQRKAQKPGWVLRTPLGPVCYLYTQLWPGCYLHPIVSKSMWVNVHMGVMALWELPDQPCLAQHTALPPLSATGPHLISSPPHVGLMSLGPVWAPVKQQCLTAQKDKLLHVPQSAQPWARQNSGHIKDQMPAFQNQHVMPQDTQNRIQSYFIYSTSTVKLSGLLNVSSSRKVERVQTS